MDTWPQLLVNAETCLSLDPTVEWLIGFVTWWMEVVISHSFSMSSSLNYLSGISVLGQSWVCFGYLTTIWRWHGGWHNVTGSWQSKSVQFTNFLLVYYNLPVLIHLLSTFHKKFKMHVSYKSVQYYVFLVELVIVIVVNCNYLTCADASYCPLLLKCWFFVAIFMKSVFIKCKEPNTQRRNIIIQDWLSN